MKILNAFYYRQHMYTLVPRYVREDMQWLADVGTTTISIGVLEQDLYASARNIEVICDEAHRAGLDVFAVPSRWGGLMAGSLKVPSQFTVTHPETWVVNSDGTPFFTPVSGPASSIYHEATEGFVRESLETLLQKFPFSGIIWDEIKVFDVLDYNHVQEGRAWKDALADHRQEVAKFFGRLNTHIKTLNPDLPISLFLYANMDEATIRAAAEVADMDYFGCDGKASRPEDPGRQEDKQKTLLGPGERFIAEARKRGLGTMMLIENHNTDLAGMETLDKRLPETLELDVDHWIYYYYGRNCDDPDGVMEIMARHLKKEFAATSPTT